MLTFDDLTRHWMHWTKRIAGAGRRNMGRCHLGLQWLDGDREGEDPWHRLGHPSRREPSSAIGWPK